jgi:hypothetical protein
LKHVAVWIRYKVLFIGYLFTPYFKKNSVVHTENEVVQGDYKYISESIVHSVLNNKQEKIQDLDIYITSYSIKAYNRRNVNQSKYTEEYKCTVCDEQ